MMYMHKIKRVTVEDTLFIESLLLTIDDDYCLDARRKIYVWLSTDKIVSQSHFTRIY